MLSFLMLKLPARVLARVMDPNLRLHNLGIGTFEDIYEPSAAQQLPDGRLLNVDETGMLFEDNALNVWIMRAFGRKLADLEGLSLDETRFIFGTTLPFLNWKGERKPDRKQMQRFRIPAPALGRSQPIEGLRERSPLTRSYAKRSFRAATRTLN